MSDDDKVIMRGYTAVANAARAVQPDVISAYPITPQTGVVEGLSQMAADGQLEGEFLKVDSEFNAASTCIGASSAGARTFSATSSQGLQLMSEPLFTAAGSRLPIVMAVANRSLSAPLSIWADHTDAFASRDGGMIQFFAEDVQEAVDNILMAYKVGEDPEVSLPVLSNFDGFILTHVQEPVNLFDEEEVGEYLPPRRVEPDFNLDPSNPVSMGAYARPEHWTETRYTYHDALMRSKDKIGQAVEEFADQFGREYALDSRGLVESYSMEDADVALITLGSLAGTVKEVVDEYRANGEKVGLVRPRVFRPFPVEELREALYDVESIGVLEKHVSPGYTGGLATELKSALYSTDIRVPVQDYVLGLAGRDVTTEELRDIVDEQQRQAKKGTFARQFEEEESWPQLREEILPEEVSH
jgi:pyruvate ferredoxin oxidoreductase alpha subunit